MKSSEVVHVLRGSIAATKEKGVEQVSIADLEAYAERLEEVVEKTPENVAVGDAAMEAYRADLTAGISSSQQQHEYNLEMLRSVITVGQFALKSSLLINGGAAVALLAFIGNIWKAPGSGPSISLLATAMLHYVAGVLSSAMASGATYFSQAGYGGEFGTISTTAGRIGHFLAVIFVFWAYFLFGRGSWLSFSALL
ncbi:hypothetical protein DFO67_108125 [Modicisalibacter xianhensis]|uniref:Uncharacterized protein n=1 Tax=Modicisalibacter xianhensis TaxID=442341 RepID=A0A4R8FR88_9GAMM|nr:hypothetical protein [Halomonas xianhensis]TDX29081.1 hypothetical protein DFO67_108125 [Halomonas xianhensis]